MPLHLSVKPPFRLDRTVTVLQRLPGNVVDVLAGGEYLRAFDTPSGPVIWRVRQVGEGRLAVALEGAVADVGPWRARLRRMLGLGVDLAPFVLRARRIPEVAPLVPLAHGFRPPRFASLHEAFAAVVLFQQVSLAAAIAILGRLVAALATPVALDAGASSSGPPPHAGGEATSPPAIVHLYPFPSAETIADAPEALLREAGLSGAKVRSLRAACAAVASGDLRDEDLEPLSSPLLVERLRELPGIGPWTANLIALRYFGRLDVFPPGDVAAAKALAELGTEEILDRLGPWRGMLYYLLFARRMALAGKGAWADVAPARAAGRGATRDVIAGVTAGARPARASRRRRTIPTFPR
jgi:DNA-3-methyladenine glycosylase II